MKATLTTKGQLTLPKAVRQALGLKAGDEFLVSIEEGRIVLRPRPRYRADDLPGLVPRAERPYPGPEGERAALVKALVEKEPR